MNQSCGVTLDEADHPPVANGGQDLVVQPQDSVTLNGIQSKDDNGIASYQWQLLTPYPYAFIEVSKGIVMPTVQCSIQSGDIQKLGQNLLLFMILCL